MKLKTGKFWRWQITGLVGLLLLGVSGCGEVTPTTPGATAQTSTSGSSVATRAATPPPVSLVPTAPPLAATNPASPAGPVPTVQLAGAPTTGRILGSGGGLAFALLGDNRLIAVDVGDGSLLADQPVGRPPANRSMIRLPGHYLTLGNNGQILYLLAPGWQDEPDRLVAVDAATTRIVWNAALNQSEGRFTGLRPPATGSVYRSLAVGPKSGRIYLFGNRAGSVIVTVVDPANGMELNSWIAHERDGLNWQVYQGQVSEDERQLYVAYHGDETSGIDQLELTGNGLQRCPPVRQFWGCIGSHGAFQFYEGGLLMGYGYQVVVGQDRQGNLLHGYDTRLPQTHVAEFALDLTTRRLYAIGLCSERAGAGGGFSSVDLNKPMLPLVPGEQQWPNPGPPPLVLVTADPNRTDQNLPCGERLAVAPNSKVVVGKIIPGPAYQVVVSTSGGVQIVDGNTARVLKEVPTNSPPLDVIVAVKK